MSGRKPRFKDASIYDSIMLAAAAIEACLKDGCRPVGHGYEEVMPYFRKAAIDGVAGRTLIKAGSNDPQVMLLKEDRDEGTGRERQRDRETERQRLIER